MIYGLLGSILLAIAAFFFGMNVGEDRQVAKESQVRDIAEKAADSATRAAAGAIAKLTPKNVTIRQTLEKEIHENTVYRDCKSSDDLVRAFNSAIPSSASANSAGRRKLPTEDTAR